MSRTKQCARKSTGGKRKRDNSQPVSDSEPANKRSRPEQTVCDETVATASPSDLAARFTAAISKHKGDLSTIELEDLSLPASSFKDTRDFSQGRLVKDLGGFLESQTPGGSEELRSCAQKSSPHTLIITTSAIRSTDLLRAVRSYGSEDSKIAKLFAKHMKLSAMVKYVQETNFGIGAGTPQRMLALVKEDALKLDKLKRVVIDASYVDEKQRSVFDEKDVFLHVVDFLNLEKLKSSLVKGDVEVLMF